ncbi:hypothetical protein V6N11_001288 [Hibiscus sabdariffa]|uniref:DUF4283 domain-containing protein n=1 Tax=Hibiscus sabdariffa TaxID=183260 RepID=A0ABR2RZA7_9ROSI
MDSSLPDDPMFADDKGKHVTYKDSLLKGNVLPGMFDTVFLDDEDIDILDGDVVRGMIDGLISIEFSECVQKLTAKSLDQKIDLKLLGCRIGYNTLKSKIYDMWKSKLAFKLMDIENDYFLATFQSRDDFLNALVDGPWTVFCHYLTVKPWIEDFSPLQPYTSKNSLQAHRYH